MISTSEHQTTTTTTTVTQTIRTTQQLQLQPQWTGELATRPPRRGKQVIKVLTDPASSGRGGRPDEPLLLVQKLAADETDAVFGAFESHLLRFAADAGSWSPLPGGFNRWVEMYHRKVLRGSRPVLVTVHVSDCCRSCSCLVFCPAPAAAVVVVA